MKNVISLTRNQNGSGFMETFPFPRTMPGKHFYLQMEDR